MKQIFQEIMTQHKVRMYPKQKARFRDYISGKFTELGWNVSIDKHKNVIVGDISKAKKVATAHYDTPFLSFYITPFTAIFGQLIGSMVAQLVVFGTIISALVLLPLLGLAGEIISFFLSAAYIATFFIPNPSNANDNTSGVVAVYEVAKKLKDMPNKQDFAFILFNCEELGLIGSASFKNSYVKQYGQKPPFEVYNLDCVAHGDSILVASKKPCTAQAKTEAAVRENNMPLLTIKASMLTVASDNLMFNNACMITVVAKSKTGKFYLPSIHMPNDKRLDDTTCDTVATIAAMAMTCDIVEQPKDSSAPQEAKAEVAQEETKQEPVQAEVVQEEVQEPVQEEVAQEVAQEPVQEEVKEETAQEVAQEQAEAVAQEPEEVEQATAEAAATKDEQEEE